MRAMTAEHERWVEFVERLAGPDGCHFRFGPDGQMHWKCAGGNDKSLAMAVLGQMGGDIDIVASLEHFEKHGGFCDCEIIFNLALCHGVLIDTASGLPIVPSNPMN